MARPRPKLKFEQEQRLNSTRPTRAQPLVVAGVCLALLWAGAAWGQQTPKEPLIDQSFSIRQDESLFEMEEAAAMVAGSLNRISDQVNILGINSLHIGGDFDGDFRRKAEVLFLEKIFQANPAVKLAQCQECQKLETKIVRGVLKLRKGIPSAEARQALAKKLGVDGFIDLGIFREKGQITVYLKVTEAKTGTIILVDEVAGRRAPLRDSLTISFGELNFPISDGTTFVTHNALAVGVNETVQLTGRFSFGVDLNFYVDNNANNTDSTISLSAGILLGPYVGYDILQMQASTSRLILYTGIGKMLSSQLNYANLFKVGLQFVVGDKLVIVLGVNSFTATDIEGGGGPQISGTGNEIRFGYRF
ncbi:MAG: hypothetical protein V3S29_02350 [bacterium]